MKRYTKIAYSVLILIVLLSGFFIYKVSGQNDSDEAVKEKALSEIHHLDEEFQGLFNQLNNISFDKYKISSTEIKKHETQESTQSSSGSSQGSTGGKSSENSQGSGSSSGGENNANAEKNKEYKLEETGILTNDSEIDWKQIKNKVENIYTFIYPMTLDMYQTNVNQEDIVNFNKQFDNLAKAVKDENTENSLTELSILYNYLPKFMENCTDDKKEKIVIKTKNNIFKAYSILNTEDWNKISENINFAVQDFTDIVTDINNQENGKQYNINKSYIIINEMQNAVNLKDKEVFLIKYKNLLEELKNI